MRNYKKTTVTVAGVITTTIEMWDEHNHAAVYNDNILVFDGYRSEACKVFNSEVKKVCDAATACGLPYIVK